MELSRHELATPARLRAFFAPRSVALVGASDGSGWARFVVESLRTAGLPGPIVPVHRSNATAFGQPAIRSLRDLEHPVDLAFVFVPTESVESVLHDAAAAGVRNVIVLASGFGEGGAVGRGRERRLTDIAIDHDLTLLGPNCLGYINAHAQAAPFGLHIIPPLLPGPVGIVLQSGALASAVMAFARARAIGISLLTSMGNEAIVTTADVVDHLISDDATKVIALFLESIRDPERFIALADKALAAGKPLVALKVGRTAAGQATALAHTGAIAGDDAVVAAVLRQHGVIRVDSLEELLITAGLFGYVEPPTRPNMGVVTASGGACDIIADRCGDEGIEIPAFAPSTVDRLSEVLPAFAAVRNPLERHRLHAGRPAGRGQWGRRRGPQRGGRRPRGRLHLQRPDRADRPTAGSHPVPQPAGRHRGHAEPHRQTDRPLHQYLYRHLAGRSRSAGRVRGACAGWDRIRRTGGRAFPVVECRPATRAGSSRPDSLVHSGWTGRTVVGGGRP